MKSLFISRIFHAYCLFGCGEQIHGDFTSLFKACSFAMTLATDFFFILILIFAGFSYQRFVFSVAQVLVRLLGHQHGDDDFSDRVSDFAF